MKRWRRARRERKGGRGVNEEESRYARGVGGSSISSNFGNAMNKF